MLSDQLLILEQTFKFFSKEKFGGSLTDENTIITIQSKGKANCYGWCTVETAWYKGKEEANKGYLVQYNEINISAEYLNRSFGDTIGTLLHEMVHLDNILHGIVDCSSKQFHNEKFKTRAESIGLIVSKLKRYGWATTSLSAELKLEIDNYIENNNIDVCIFDVARKDKVIKKVNRSNKKVKMICKGCQCVVTCEEEIAIICKDCDLQFVKK